MSASEPRAQMTSTIALASFGRVGLMQLKPRVVCNQSGAIRELDRRKQLPCRAENMTMRTRPQSSGLSAPAALVSRMVTFSQRHRLGWTQGLLIEGVMAP